VYRREDGELNVAIGKLSTLLGLSHDFVDCSIDSGELLLLEPWFVGRSENLYWCADEMRSRFRLRKFDQGVTDGIRWGMPDEMNSLSIGSHRQLGLP
jgi:hypothetical protein